MGRAGLLDHADRQVLHHQALRAADGRPADWRLDVTGLVKQPLSLTLDQLKARPRQEVTFTLECSGNTGLPFFWGGIGNATWAGTPLAPLLQEAGILDGGKEIVFYAHDIGKQKVRDMDLTTPFARSMSVIDAMSPENLLCYEMNGQPLDAGHGAPLRLLTPGWYGVANVKWLDRIEVIDTRFAGHFMARDYVTIREEQRDGQPVWTETLVGKALLKSAPARVTRKDGDYRIAGAAWGGPIASVEVQVDGGPWMPATITEGGGARRIRGNSGGWTGAARRPASTPSPRGRPTPPATSSRP